MTSINKIKIRTRSLFSWFKHIYVCKSMKFTLIYGFVLKSYVFSGIFHFLLHIIYLGLEKSSLAKFDLWSGIVSSKSFEQHLHAYFLSILIKVVIEVL